MTKSVNSVGFFSEMHTYDFDNGSIQDYLCDSVDYDKDSLIKYLKSFGHKTSCSRAAIDCVTGEKIASYFCICFDGEFYFPDYLIYHIKKYNLRLPQRLIQKANKA